MSAAPTMAANHGMFDYQPQDGVVRIYGAGGPHTAIKRTGEAFTKQTGVPVEVVSGPGHKWTEDAQRNADII